MLVKLCALCERKKAMPDRDLCFNCAADLDDAIIDLTEKR